MATTTTKLLALLLVGGCGRSHFDPVPRDGDAVRVDADLSPGVGCADHTREAFETVTDFPDLAGCRATWTGQPSLRAPRTGTPCGDDLGTCTAPADACADGWHLCGTSGDPTELAAEATHDECENVGGAGDQFVAAMSHCADDQDPGCQYADPMPCLEQGVGCTEPVCCGRGCSRVETCEDGVYEAETGVVAGGVGYACTALDAGTIAGVLCCRDERAQQSGCADGQREAFVNETTYPTIAGCRASWTQTQSLRNAKTGAVCGDDAADCASPADACAPGWSICGDTGDPTDLSGRITSAQCDLQGPSGEQYAAAISHCVANIPSCEYAPTYDCIADDVGCSEAVCCGFGCSGLEDCVDGVFAGTTSVTDSGERVGCGAEPPGAITGVMCCLR